MSPARVNEPPTRVAENAPFEDEAAPPKTSGPQRGARSLYAARNPTLTRDLGPGFVAPGTRGRTPNAKEKKEKKEYPCKRQTLT